MPITIHCQTMYTDTLEKVPQKIYCRRKSTKTICIFHHLLRAEYIRIAVSLQPKIIEIKSEKLFTTALAFHFKCAMA